MSTAASPSIGSPAPVDRPGAIRLASALLLFGAAVLATFPVWADIFAYASRNEEQSHSFVAIPVAAWLLWMRRGTLLGMRLAWGLAGPLVIGAGWALAAAGFRTGVDLFLHIGSLLIVVGAIYTGVGWRVFMRALPAIGALALVLPVPGRIRLKVAGPLQEYSAQISQFVLDLFNAPVLRTGNVLAINGVEVTIAEACNGMRMVSALAVITYAFVFSMPLRPAARLGIFAASPLVALALNVLRLIPTVLFYGYTEKDTAEAFHDLSGWGSLFLAVAMLLGITSMLKWLEVPIEPPAGAARPVAATPASAGRPGPLRWAAPVAAAGVLGAMVALGGFDVRVSADVAAYHAKVREQVDALPYRIQGALGIDQPVSPGVERILSPNAMLQRRFTDPYTGKGYGLMVIHCRDVRDLVDHYPPVCYPANGWLPQGMTGQSFHLGDIVIPARLYEFARLTGEAQVRTRVLSFFVLPGKRGAVDNMDDVESASRSTAAAALGAAHVMVSFSGDESEEEIATTVRRVLEPLEDMIRTTLGGTAGE